MANPHLHLQADRLYPFGAFDALNAGRRAMRFVDDHDPLPLPDQLRQRYGAKVDILCVQRESGAIAIDFVRQ